MSEPTTFEEYADDLEGRLRALGNLGVTVKFVLEGMGNLFIDARHDLPILSRNDETDADFTVIGPFKVWLDLRARRTVPYAAVMTGRVKFKGDLKRGLSFAPKFMSMFA